MGYRVILEQEPDGGYVVTVPALPGCVTKWPRGQRDEREQ